MENSIKNSSTKGILGNTFLRLSIVFICSLFPPLGMLMIFFTHLFGGGNEGIHQDRFAIGSILIAIGPILLGLFFNLNWRGLLSGIIGAIWAFIFLMALTGDLQNLGVSVTIAPVLILVLASAGSILILLMASGNINWKENFVKILLGLLLGSILGAGAYSFPDWSGGLINMIIVFPLIWLSACLLPELHIWRTR